ncbi:MULTISPECIES: hypothetical protein [unclassified Fusibacter]|uniref:hypothetical protein n=1 Tax=unclassified Fusibacter TaxID=2624464 RepID=UPI0010104D01|nr:MULTISPECIES: hypothetical protein [unclassified Fusibacter]MCK8059773.1 hypothetical protein [Fusibacter sp. A2]NPE21574.1 hypothetical protein [Fusibacter sp. A1]RXV61982.1 hypothetical protein DWB64_07010 [Fusibacter sp. A1]
MGKDDLMKMFSMIVGVFIVFSVFRSWENSGKVAFAKDAESIIVYDVSYAQGRMMEATDLEKVILKTVEEPNLFFKSITHDDDKLTWDGDYYGRIITKEGEIIHVRFSDFAYVFEKEDYEGHFRFRLSNSDSWMFY